MQGNKKTSYLQYIKSALVNAGKIIENTKSEGYKVIRKHIKEMVTEIDMAVQTYLIDYLSAETGCTSFISEEIRIPAYDHNEFWVIDPLDGTHNFIAGLPFYGISIAYVENSSIEYAGIYFPQSQLLYHAQRGKGAYKNDTKIQVSVNDDIEKSIIAYDNQFYLDKQSITNFIKIQEKVFTTRILGVAARDACFVAEGVLDARIWNNTKLCDVAAASLIVKEAGGSITDFDGNQLDLHAIRDVVCSNGKFHDEILSVLKRG